MTDIITELDRWLEWNATFHRARDDDAAMIQRARDEIVALRTQEGETLHRLYKGALANARAEEREPS
jgi:hypothetical protein